MACSNYVKTSYVRSLGLDASRVEVIYNSVDPAGLRSKPGVGIGLSMDLALPENAFVYLNVGRLDPQKNQRLLLRAFAGVIRAQPTAYLVIVGVGPLEAELRRLASDLGIGNRVLFAGRRSDIADLLSLADVFVFPSLFEGLGVALIEAMFAGLPCIVSDIEVFREFVVDDKNALEVSQYSADEMTAAMLRLRSDEQLRTRLGFEARATAERLFTVDVTTKKWESLYTRLNSRMNLPG